MSFILEFDDNNFDTEITEPDAVVLVDFWAPWCGPCKMLHPIIEQIGEQYAGKIKIGKVNIDENRALAAKYEVMSIPTLLLFENGKVVEKMIGARSKANIEALLNEHI